jgi:hypothetical protein
MSNAPFRELFVELPRAVLEALQGIGEAAVARVDQSTISGLTYKFLQAYRDDIQDVKSRAVPMPSVVVVYDETGGELGSERIVGTRTVVLVTRTARVGYVGILSDCGIELGRLEASELVGGSFVVLGDDVIVTLSVGLP